MKGNLHIIGCIGREAKCIDKSERRGKRKAGKTLIPDEAVFRSFGHPDFRTFCKFLPEFYKNRTKKTAYFYVDMKKFLVSIIAVLYLGTSMGATVNLHYCMGRLVDWDFSHEEDHTCGKCGMEKTAKSGCCEDKYKVVQVEKDHKAGSTYQLMQPPVIEHTTNYPSIGSVVVITLSQEQPVSNGPPRSQVPVHIRLCVFRI